MDKNKNLLAEEIKKKILSNFVGYAKLFTPFQSDFLVGLYGRYQCLDNGSLVLYFAKKTHQAILRNKEYDLGYDLSFEKFWNNHSNILIPPATIMNIAKDSNLPKETTRRKLSELIKHKIFIKKNKHIVWLPGEEYKQNYNKFVAQEIRSVAKLTKYVTDIMNLNFSVDEITIEYHKKFSFYWFHFLDLQLKWMKLWKKRFNDLEIALIFLQLSTLLSSKLTIDKTISHRSLYEEPSIINTPGVQNVSISATSVSDITGIPRATCIRKLNLMAKQKIVSQDKNSKRYYIIPEAFNKNLVSKDLTEEASTIYSEFYYISIKALSSKNLH